MELPKTLGILYMNHTKFPPSFDLRTLPLNQLKTVKWNDKTLTGSKLDAMLYTQNVLKSQHLDLKNKHR